MNRLKILITLFFATLIYYLPILANPDLFLNRGNDLQEFFWPLIHFTKQQLIITGTLPFWYNTILSGTPLLSDPQSPLFYPPNIIFLLLPIGLAFIYSFILHTFIGGIGAYLVARKGLNFSKISSTFISLLYVSSPKIAGYIEAGHVGLIYSWAWVPFVLLTTILLAKKPNMNSSILLSLSLAGLFFTHTPTFFLTSIASGVLLLIIVKKTQKNYFTKSVFFFAISAMLTFGMVAVALIPQLEFIAQSNRVFLLNKPEVYPIWFGKLEFIKTIIFPWSSGTKFIWNLDTEKWVVLGIFPILLATIGFFKLKRFHKLITFFIFFTLTLIATNNLFFFNISSLFKPFAILRVTTRIWFIVVLFTTLLAGYGLERAIKKGLKHKIVIIFAVLAIIESTALSWVYLAKPINKREYASQDVINYLKKDQDRFRVFCIDRCISIRTAAQNNLELVDGYSTLIQKNYYKHAWQLTGTYWEYYSLAVPPIGTYKDVTPNATSLGEFNTKYVISPRKLNLDGLVLEEKIDNYLIYKNSYYKPRSNYQIDIYTPNHIRIKIPEGEPQMLFISEVYNSGWKAYANGVIKVPVQEMPNTLRKIKVPKNTKFIDIKYQPTSYAIGVFITTITFFIIFLTLIWGIKK